MADLSKTSGVAVATIKMYLREGLLPAGERVAANQARYGEEHLQRLRLIRALVTVGGLRVAAARKVLTAIDSDAPVAEAFEVAQHAVSESADAEPDEDALGTLDALTNAWHVSPGNPGRMQAARAIQSFRDAGQQDLQGWLTRYASAALAVAEADLDEVDARPGRAAKVETVVVGTVLGDALFSGLRRVAQEHVSMQRFTERTGDD